MVIYTSEIRLSDGTQDAVYNEFKMAYVYCADDETEYCVSLSRCYADELVEIMVHNQKCLKTRDLTVELSRDQLRIKLAVAVANELDGVSEYFVTFRMTKKQLADLDATLVVIFEGGNRGTYNRLY